VLASGELISTTQAATQSIPAWFVYRFRDGLISAVETYLDPKAAAKQANATGH
jgi:ketosteroid isomerase-like protein